MFQSPVISVAMSVYNGARFLPAQLDSILAQTHRDFELVAVDDGSRDDSMTILQAYAARDPRLRVEANPQNLGPTRSFERAMGLCRGAFLAPADQDDLWHPEKLAVLLAAIGDHDLAYGNSIYIDETGRPTGRSIADDLVMLQGRLPLQFTFMNSVSGHALLLRRDLFELARPLPPKLYYDWVLAMYAAARHGVVYVNRPLVRFRRHKQAYSSLGKKKKTPAPSCTPDRRSHNRIWFNERRLLLKTLAQSPFDSEGRAARMLAAIDRSLDGGSALPLLVQLWRERASVPQRYRWAAFSALHLQNRMLRKLRRALREAPVEDISIGI